MKINLKTIIVLGLVLAASLFVSGCLSSDQDKDFNNVGMMSFKSEKEMKAYLNNISSSGSYSSAVFGTNMVKDEGLAVSEAPASAPVPPSPSSSGDIGYGSDYSKTNVQIAGVDEADMVKTDGKIIYYTPSLYYPANVTSHDNDKYSYYTYDTYQMTYIIDALPAATASIISEIVGTGGSLYLFNDTLITIKTGWDDRNVVAYDVSNPSSPVKSWEQSYDGYYSSSRMVDGKLYLITQEYGISPYPLLYRGHAIAATDVYYPSCPGIIYPGTDITYFVSKIDIDSGSFEKTIALIGSYSSILFASGDNLYLTNHYFPNTQLMYMDFVTTEGARYLPSNVMSHIKKVMGYDLSDYIKYIAVSEDVSNHFNSLGENESAELSMKFYQDYNNYSAALVDKAERTTITKISMETFDIISGSVPGNINGQFSLDENGGNLRVISTKGDNWRSTDFQTSTIVTVFDSNMKIIGDLDGLAPGGYVWSTRYIGNTLYITVYTEENDPFLVVDLSDPANPKELGRMRLAGSYSYLYPINDTLIVGFGTTDDWRDWRTKLSLYDVSDPTRPVELDAFYFDKNEYASVYDYHGLTWNAGRNLMVVPGSHAYVLKIENGDISLVKDDSHGNGFVSRSVYIGNSLYTFSDREVHVYDMDSWQLVKVIPIKQPVYPTYEYDYIYPVH